MRRRRYTKYYVPDMCIEYHDRKISEETSLVSYNSASGPHSTSVTNFKFSSYIQPQAYRGRISILCLLAGKITV
jgi:hypothetical protein